jgi:hypothetical protein
MLSGAVASAASAQEFVAKEYPVKVKALNKNDQGFQISGAVSVCEGAEFEGEGTEASPTLTVHPEYFECEAELGSKHNAKVNTKGCNYEFFATGSVNIVCENTGEEIEVTVEGIAGCIIKIPAQPNLETVTYENITGEVEVRAEVSGIHWSTTSGCKLSPSSGTNGEYREGLFKGGRPTGTPELAPINHPAKARTAGTNEFGAFDAIEVT